MTFMFSVPSVVLFTSAAVALFVALASLRRTSVNGGLALSLMMFCVFIWAAGAGFEAAATSTRQKILFSTISYVGTVNVAPLFLVFALRYRRRIYRLVGWLVALLWLVPVLTLLLVLTNGEHGLVWRGFSYATSSPNVLVYHHGPWFYASVVYFALLCFIAAILIVRATLRDSRTFVAQTGVLLVGLVVPWLATALELVPFNPLPWLDLPPAAFSITGILLLVGMSRFSLLDLVPVARHMVVEQMTDGFMVLDAHERLVDINPTARALFDAQTARIGAAADELEGVLGSALVAIRSRPGGHLDIAIPGNPGRYLEMRCSALANRAGRVTARLLVVRDVTDARRMEQEREGLIGELQAALGDVKALSGLLPICASCRRVRDDTGYWRTLEKYISDHSQAQFSHGLCDDCMRRLYPELLPEGPGTSS